MNTNTTPAFFTNYAHHLQDFLALPEAEKHALKLVGDFVPEIKNYENPAYAKAIGSFCRYVEDNEYLIPWLNRSFNKMLEGKVSEGMNDFMTLRSINLPFSDFYMHDLFTHIMRFTNSRSTVYQNLKDYAATLPEDSTKAAVALGLQQRPTPDAPFCLTDFAGDMSEFAALSSEQQDIILRRTSLIALPQDLQNDDINVAKFIKAVKDMNLDKKVLSSWLSQSIQLITTNKVAEAEKNLRLIIKLDPAFYNSNIAHFTPFLSSSQTEFVRNLANAPERSLLTGGTLPSASVASQSHSNFSDIIFTPQEHIQALQRKKVGKAAGNDTVILPRLPRPPKASSKVEIRESPILPSQKTASTSKPHTKKAPHNEAPNRKTPKTVTSQHTKEEEVLENLVNRLQSKANNSNVNATVHMLILYAKGHNLLDKLAEMVSTLKNPDLKDSLSNYLQNNQNQQQR